MLKNSKAKNRDDLKKFVLANFSLYEKAYLEFYKNKHHLNKHHSEENNFSKFINITRKEFNYSEKTSKVDIWYQFIFKDIVDGILKKHYPPKKEEVRKEATDFINDLEFSFLMRMMNKQK